MRNYSVFIFVLVSILFIQPCFASIQLVTPLAFSSTNIHLGDSFTVSANWNETVNSFVVEYNSTSSDLINETINNNNNTWTNYTISTNNNWLLDSHSIRMYVTDPEQFATDYSIFNVFGHSQSLINLSSYNATILSPVLVSCRVIDVNSSKPIANYYVEASSSIEGDISPVAGLTNSTGYREGTFTPTKDGIHLITCGIDDNPNRFYTTLSKGSVNLTVNLITMPTFYGKGILNVEDALTKSGLIELPSGLNASLEDYKIVINNQENSTMNFSLYIGNQLVLENSISANGSYVINYSTILDWKDTYHLVNLHKVRIKVEGTHGFKSLITQNFTDVYADIVVNKKYSKNYEINVSSPEHLQNISIEGVIPSEIDVNSVKLYHWNDIDKKYEDVTASSQYGVTIYKMDRKIRFTVPSLSTQSFILAEGEMTIPTTTMITTREITTTTREPTTTTRITTKLPTTTILQCPTCPDPSAWSECINGKKSRTNYKCYEKTDFKCESFTETEGCVVSPNYSFVLLVILVIAFIVYLAWKFNLVEKIPGRKSKYHYKGK